MPVTVLRHGRLLVGWEEGMVVEEDWEEAVLRKPAFS